MGQYFNKPTNDPEMLNLANQTGFKLKEIEYLSQRFNFLDTDHDGFLSRFDFDFNVALSANPLSERIIKEFFRNENNEQQLKITFKRFVTTLARFKGVDSGLSSIEEKLKLVFRIYDTNDDGYIDRDDLLDIVSMLIKSKESESILDCIVDQTMTEADVDKDGRISFEEFLAIMASIKIMDKMTLNFTK